MRLCLSYKYSRRILYKVVYNILAISNDKYNFCKYIVKVLKAYGQNEVVNTTADHYFVVWMGTSCHDVNMKVNKGKRFTSNICGKK